MWDGTTVPTVPNSPARSLFTVDSSQVFLTAPEPSSLASDRDGSVGLGGPLSEEEGLVFTLVSDKGEWEFPVPLCKGGFLLLESLRIFAGFFIELKETVALARS